ncbi:MAG TPA: V-type ATP synthase subunit E [Synergistales bacterium]|mgnify:CR=1 FL=1|nr:V-type ATP synthase subunit E [Synergistales bacterium]HQQ10731.1 V-type ATP synthase subunit E [Synergistales bacterium]
MSLADIKAKIEADAKAEAEEIIGKFKEQADEILAAARLESEKIQKRLEEKIRSEETEVRRRKKIVADLEVRKLDLGARRELIEMTFNKVLHVLSQTSDSRYLAFMEGLMAEGAANGDEEVLLAKNEKRVTKKWIEEFNEKYKKGLSLSDEMVPGSGGFALRRNDISVNCTLEVLLRWVREDMEAEVVSRLFSE